MPPKKDRTTSYLALEASSPTFRLKQRILADILANLLAVPATRAWDAGCGAGTLSAMLARHTCEELFVSDIEESSVRATLGRLAGPGRLRVSGRVLDLERDAPPGGRFDLILCWAVLEHLADDRAGIATLARALAPKGFLIINVPLHPRLMNELDRLEDHHRRYTRRRLEDLLGSAGLRMVRFRTFGFPGLLATKILWARFSRHEAAVAGSGAARIAARVIAATDFAAYRALTPWGVEGVVVAGHAGPGGDAGIPR